MEMTAATVARTEEDVATLEDQMAEIQTELDIAQLKAAIAANQHSQCKECGTGQYQHKRQRSMCKDGSLSAQTEPPVQGLQKKA
jgi:hypothetical protein